MPNSSISVKAIMTKDVVTVKPETPIYEALHLLNRHYISGMPVIDDQGIVVGILSEKDVLEILLQPSLNPKDTVANYMTTNVFCFNEEDSIVTICKFFKNNPIRRVPIVRDGGKLAGIVSRRDIISTILEINSQISDLRFS